MLLAACSGPGSGGPFAHRRDAVVGGTDDPNDNSVFLLDMTFDTTARTVCSAVLIGSRTLATAAHCIDPARQTGATSVLIQATHTMVASQATLAERFDVVSSQLHPTWDPAAAASPDDFALLLLSSAPPAVIPSEINRAGLSGFTGQTMRAVGYGRTLPATSDSGTRRAVAVLVTSDDVNHIFFGASGTAGICSGDSGGPSFYAFSDGVERVVGLHSYQESASCGDGADVRVDRFLSFVDDWLTAKDPPPCAADGVCSMLSCPTPDPDCVPVGQPCTADLQCAGRKCAPDAQHPAAYCTRACVNLSACPTGMQCTAGLCALGQLTPAAMGDACTVGVHWCAEGSTCTGPVGSPSSCRPSCDTEGHCPASSECVAGSNAAKYCKASVVEPPAGLDGVAGSFGCSAAPGSMPFWALAALAFLGLARNVKGSSGSELDRGAGNVRARLRSSSLGTRGARRAW